MDRSLILFWSGMLLVIALLVPMSLLQDSRSAGVSKVKNKKKLCSAFERPEAPAVGRFRCYTKKKNRPGEKNVCRLVCPQPLMSRPLHHRLIYRCHRGRWEVDGPSEVHCVARTSVTLVEQQSAPPTLLNSLLSRYMNVSNNYLTMAYFMDRADVQLPGFHKYFLGLWQKSVDQVRSIMAYINKRGGWIDVKDMPRPSQTEILQMGQQAGFVGLVGMETALEMERQTHRLVQHLINLMEARPKNHDPHMMHTLEDQYLSYEVKLVKELMDHITQLRYFQETGQDDYKLGEYELDTNLQ